MTALHLQRLSWVILERLKLRLCEVLRWLNRQHWTDVQTDVHIVPVDSNAQSRNLLKMPTASGENGAGGETRTPNRPITNRVLYQLSHASNGTGFSRVSLAVNTFAEQKIGR